MYPKKTCQFCGKKYFPKNIQQSRERQTCRKVCAARLKSITKISQRNWPETKECIICKKPWAPTSRSQVFHVKTCSKECFSELCCESSNGQLLCENCHTKKSSQDRHIFSRFRKGLLTKEEISALYEKRLSTPSDLLKPLPSKILEGV